MRILFIAWLMTANSFVHAQIFDTVRYSLKQKPRVFFQIDTYNSFVSKEPANTFGLRGGLEYNRRVRFGIGFYNLASDIVKRKLITGVFDRDTLLNTKLELNFIPLSAEYIFYNRYPWEISAQTALGFGSSYFFYFLNASGDKKRVDEKGISLLILAGGAQYKITRWLGIGSGIGFRVMLKDNSSIDENFNSIIYSLQLRIFPGAVYRAIFKKEQKD
jgi:hypothetical protein